MVVPGSAVPLMMGEAVGILPPAAGLLITGADGAVVSTVNTSVATGLVLPAASVEVAVTVCGPLAMPRVGAQLQVPPALTTAVHSVMPLSLTVIVVSGSPVPLKSGLLLFVLLPLLGAVTVGVTGATVSTPNETGGDVSGPTCACTVTGPCGSGVEGAQLQVPAAVVVVVHNTVPVGCRVTVTGVFGVPVPLNAGVVLPTAAFAAGAVIDGAVLSTAKLRVAAGPVLPAASVAVTLRACGPLFSGVTGVQLQLPPASAMAMQSVLPSSSFTVTWLNGSANPTTVGVLSPVVVPATGVVMLGAIGGTVSTVTRMGVPAWLVLPAGSVVTA